MSQNLAQLMHEAVQYFRGGDLARAEQATRRILGKQPRNPEALHLRGVILALKGEAQDAVGLFRRALARDERNVRLRTHLGKALFETGDYQGALDAYDRAIQLGGATPEIMMDRGTAFRHLGRYSDALACYEQALGMRPDYAEAWANKGALLDELHRPGEAVACHDRAIAIDPMHANAWINKGVSLAALGSYGDALACYERAISIAPRNPQPWVNRGVTLENMKRHADALACYAKAVEIRPDYALAHYNEGMCRLSLCDFAKGWEQCEWRRDHPHNWNLKHAIAGRNAFPGVAEWSGERGCRSVLVWAEQGIGDQILYASMLDELRQYTARLLVSADARLLPLFERSFPGIQFVPHEQARLASHNVERQIPMGSIGRYCRTRIEDFAGRKPAYLVADGDKSAALKRRLAQGTGRVCGLSWISKNQKIGADKSLALSDLAPLLALPGMSFVDLQYGDTAEERAQLKAGTGIDVVHFDDIDNFNDIDGLAALIDACDLVVTISNVTAHLAGALGKSTFLLLPRARGRLWYWHEGHATSLWYPSVRIFPQTADGDWQLPVDQIVRSLA